jgi:hypothetical protein
MPKDILQVGPLHRGRITMNVGAVEALAPGYHSLLLPINIDSV